MPRSSPWDGALGFWKALREVFPTTREQRCWVHENRQRDRLQAQVTQSAAKKAVQGVYNAEACDHAEQAIGVVTRLYQAKFPKSRREGYRQEGLLEFYGYLAEH
ncbi:transposase [Streptomyces sp. NPDC056704]|uniref:transposase n=1 Tax=Streptomyces TaxID=1883 RepID=UPI00368F317B